MLKVFGTSVHFICRATHSPILLSSCSSMSYDMSWMHRDIRKHIISRRKCVLSYGVRPFRPSNYACHRRRAEHLMALMLLRWSHSIVQRLLSLCVKDVKSPCDISNFFSFTLSHQKPIGCLRHNSVWSLFIHQFTCEATVKKYLLVFPWFTCGVWCCSVICFVLP